MSSPTQFGLAVQNPVRVQRVVAISPIGPERALLWRRRLSDAVDERRDERGVALAERVQRVWGIYLDGGPEPGGEGLSCDT